ncbi:nuclear transport factor 2 family protein [Lampropedia aestuarii]|uniref:Nuclear transport factor 2 family protein n=1 Tax=Lampropedia aestuarii TaxID=2562762 RepID=A0A4S5BMT5_9BURK|nr:nuclear transport factor 2 family protein [Lampropedia aestuarii]MDH5859054.1 nuclear transport factor 2 family protein [Lampropedia aestuarii]THJ32161.1 nuclear transport factor 2 family protein [Lampropedia aestuarii]
MTDPIAQWHEIVRNRDADQLRALLHTDVVFQSPAMHTPQVGVAKTQQYLLAALAVLGPAQFRYEREWRGAQSAVLEFTAQIDGIAINGVDLIDWDTDGRITRFTVMVRPLKALQTLVAHMGAQLTAPPSAQP